MSGLHIRRGELRLGRSAAYALKAQAEQSDPLSAFAQVVADTREDLDEDARVKLSFLPLPAGSRHSTRHRLVKAVLRSTKPRGPIGTGVGGGSGSTFMADVFDELTSSPGSSRGSGSRPRGRQTAIEVVDQRRGVQELSKLVGAEAMFDMQVLLRVQSVSRDRANELFQALLGAFAQFDGDNYLRESGLRPGGVVLFKSDVSWRRGWFDFRWRTGYFRPASGRGGNIVNASEVAGFLKPPTVWCREPNVARMGPYLPAAPAELPEYVKEPGVLPLGMVKRRGDERAVMCGMHTNDFLFGMLCGQTGAGKTELALGQLLHVCLVERETGAFFYDPHVDALERVKPYFTGPGVRERVIEMNLVQKNLDARHVGWNLLSMEGLGEEWIGDRAKAICDAINAVPRPPVGTRSSPMLKQAVTALLYVSLSVPPDLQPTIFTVPRLLQDEAFRLPVVARLPRRYRDYWLNEFATYGVDATSPICQFIRDMGAHPTVRATFGSPRSTYDPRRAMDDGAIVLAASSDHLVYGLVMRALIDAAKSRWDTAVELRRVVYAFFDEAQIGDREIADSSALAEVFQQLRKYKVRAMPMTQAPSSLCKTTLGAIATNASFLGTVTQAADGAAWFAKQWGTGRDIDAGRLSMSLPLYRYAMQAKIAGQRTDPFYAAGVPLEELWSEHRYPERLDELEAAINASYRPRTVRETLKLIDSHDDRILHALRNHGKGSINGNGNGVPRGAPVAATPPRGGFSFRLDQVPTTEDES